MNSTRKTDVEKVDKPLKERKRRARINDALSQLKSMVLQSVNRESISMSKLEKADILEMTIRYIQHLQNLRVQETHCADASYANGFNECTSYVVGYLSSETSNGDHNDIVKQKLLEHMASYPLTKETKPSSNEHLQEYGGDDQRLSLSNNVLECMANYPLTKETVPPSTGHLQGYTGDDQRVSLTNNILEHMANYPFPKETEQQSTGHFKVYTTDDETTFCLNNKVGSEYDTSERLTYLNQEEVTSNIARSLPLNESCIRKQQMDTRSQNVVDETFLSKQQIDTTSLNVVEGTIFRKQQMDTMSPNVVDETYLKKLQMKTQPQSVATVPKKRKVLGNIQLGINTSNNYNILKRKHDENVSLSKPLKKRTITFQESSKEDFENSNSLTQNEESLSNGYLKRTSGCLIEHENSVYLTPLQTRDCRTLNIAEDNGVGLYTDDSYGNAVRMQNHWVPNEGIFYSALSVSNKTGNPSGENIMFKSPRDLEDTVHQHTFYRSDYETFSYTKYLENGASNNFSNDTVWRPW